MSESKKQMPAYCVDIEVNDSSLDMAIEKANRLVELLREASSIIDSLSGRLDQNPS